MKRLNPATGLPFKKGDIRENGDVFYQYRKITEKWTNGYYVEYWLKPELFKKHNFTDRSGNKRTVNKLASTLLTHARNRCFGTTSRVASGRMPTNGNVTITLDWVIGRIEKGICEATGDKLTTKTKQPNTASLDRIDPNNPDYTPENSRIVTWQFNNMKGAFTDEEFIRVAKQLENVKKKSTASIPARHSGEDKIYPELGVVSLPGLGEDRDNANYHSRTISGQDADHSAQASSGDGVGCRGEEVGPPQAPQSEQDHGVAYGKIVSYEELCRHIFGKP
jgi:hypothetical protein